MRFTPSVASVLLISMLASLSTAHAAASLAIIGAVVSTTNASSAAKVSAYDQGVAAMREKKYDLAEKLLNEAALKEPKSPRPLLALAELARQQGNEALIEKWVRKAAAIAPNDPASQMGLGLVFYAKSQFSDAEAQWMLTAALAPKSVPPLIALGNLYAGPLHQPAKAADAFQKVIALQPTHAGAYLGLGGAYAAQKDYANALPALEQAHTLSPQSSMPLVEMAQVYFDQNNLTKAISTLQTAYALTPTVPDILMRLGAYYERDKQWPQAYAAYEDALKLDNKLVVAYNNLAWMAADRKERLDDAERWASTAVALRPQVDELKDTYAWVKRARGDLKGALALLQSIATEYAKNPEFFYHLGILQQESGTKVEAVSAFQRALQLNPGFPEAADTAKRLEQLQ